jgi:arsenate reductase (thioredoxin)
MTERRVLFVCVENAGRSLMAEAIFNAHAPAGWVAESAGTRPATHPNPRTERFLAEPGLILPPHSPQMVTALQMDSADVVFTTGCLDDASCPANLRGRPLPDWGLPNPAKLDDAGFQSVRDELVRRVAALSAELASDRPSAVREPAD